MKTPLTLILLALAIPSLALAQERLEFTRMIAHLSEWADPDYVDFVREAEPELVQHGFYGAHFYSLAHTPQYKGYPAHFPVQGLKECGDFLQERNRVLHELGVKVVGHFNVEFLVGEIDGPEGPRGFFKFYRDLWDEQELGPKPVQDPVDFLEKDVNGQPVPKRSYEIGKMPEYFACLRNPNWQTILRAWMKRGIERGIDGAIANYFYRHDCLCPHCQKGFRDYLRTRFTAPQLKSKFKIQDLETHVFPEIVAWHKPEETTPLRLEMLRWSQISNKEVFDEIFIKYARSLKPGFIAAQWNHLGNLSAISGDERCLLPHELWGKDEDYLWYSTGAQAYYTDLKNNFYGDATLQARFIRGAFDDKPFTLGKYESVRTRSAIAELAANGGAPMGLYAKYSNSETRAVFVQYYQFMKRYNDIYHANYPHPELRLLFPRKAIHKGDVSGMDTFRQTGRAWLDRHILFDIEPDDITRGASGYYEDKLRGEEDTLSKFEAPPWVRVSASRPRKGGEIDIHFVNYNRQEPPPKKNGDPNPGNGTPDEKPIPVANIGVDFALPPNFKLGRVEFISPETPDPRELSIERSASRVKFTVPEFLVYGVVRLIAIKEEPVPLAGITTVYTPNSHADMLLSRINQGDTLNDKGDRPALRVGKIYTEQIGEKDISRGLSSRYGFTNHEKIADTIPGAKGVLLVAEHGDYPKSDTGQVIYPKRRMFEEVFSAFRAQGHAVPVFCDKHFADNWADAKWIWDQAKELKVPLMAGSSVPGAWRYPAIDLKRGAPVKEIVAVNYGPLDAYGFHALEAVQSLVERRAGGETGVKSVQCLTGDAVWEAEKRGVFDSKLLDQVASVFRERPIPAGKTLKDILRGEPILFHVQYEDGLKANILSLNGVAEWAAAWRYGDDSTAATAFSQQEIRPYYHFAFLVRDIEGFMKTGKSPWPVERTLMTTGLLDALLVSKRDGGKVVETPYLSEIAYETTWNWTQPTPLPPGRSFETP